MVNTNKEINIFDSYLHKALEELTKSSFQKETYKNNLAEFIVEKVNKGKDSIFNKSRNYINKLSQHYCKVGKKVVKVNIKTLSRMLCDTSSPFAWLVDEIGLAWDPILDTPIIPATEIKGTLSGYISWLKDKEEFRDLLFGSVSEQATSHKSMVDFTDAYPVQGNKLLERDIITPTYEGKTESNDYKFKEHLATPTPIQFLTIPAGVTFEFLLLIDEDRLKKFYLTAAKAKNKQQNEEKLTVKEKKALKLINNAAKLLNMKEEELYNVSTEQALKRVLKKLEGYIKTALKESFKVWGLGSKTSSGYGICENEK